MMDDDDDDDIHDGDMHDDVHDDIHANDTCTWYTCCSAHMISIYVHIDLVSSQ